MISDNGQPDARISVVIPVYNVGQYIDQCLTSIREQTLRDLEIIVVNDGSTDESGKIAATHAAADSRITVVEQENRGYGAAINSGLRHVHCEYVSIVDSDDWLDPSMLQTLYTLATKHNADIAKCSYAMQYEDGSSMPVRFGHRMIPDTDTARCPSHLDLMIFPSSIWSGIYRTRFLRSNQIRMVETPGAAYQDVTWKFLCYASTTNVVLNDVPLYNYRIRNTGSSRVSRGNLTAHFTNYEYIRHFLHTHGLWEDSKQAFFIHQFTDLEFHCRRLGGEDALSLCHKFGPVLHEAETCGIRVAAATFVREDTNTHYRRRVMPFISRVAYHAAYQRRAYLEAVGYALRYGILRLRRSTLLWSVLGGPAGWWRHRTDQTT